MRCPETFFQNFPNLRRPIPEKDSEMNSSAPTARSIPTSTRAFVCSAVGVLRREVGVRFGKEVITPPAVPIGPIRRSCRISLPRYVALHLLIVFGCVLTAAITVRAQTTYEPYTFSTLAGEVGYGSADGTGSAARFNAPYGVAV